MVNYGVSKGCEACKQRRKKCDETRPTCRACVRTKRQCFYKSQPGFVFRNTYVEPQNGSRNEDLPTSSEYPTPPLSPKHNVSNEELDRQALDIFLRDYCITPGNPRVSRGYLPKAAEIIHTEGSQCEVARAARIIALDGIGRRRGRQELIEKAQWLYHAELRAFQERMSNSRLACTTESIVMITLFGIYEMISKPRPQESGHPVHALGISAILKSTANFRLLDNMILGQPWQLLESGIFSPLDASEYPSPTLDAITLQNTPLMHRSRQVMQNNFERFQDVQEVRKMCADFESGLNRLLGWAEKQPDTWQSRRAGIVDEKLRKGKHGAIFWPGPVDVYPDQWIAAVWLICHKGAVMIANSICLCAKQVPHDEEVNTMAARARETVNPLVDKIISSIPYLLLADVHSVLREGSSKVEPGPPVGGILLMHPLHVLTTMPEVISEEKIDYMRGCLAWISEYMAIGQAGELYQMKAMSPPKSVGDAHMIVWAGMLM